MAQKVLTVLTDDIDGKELKAGQGQTVSFGLDGKTYEIDLSNKNADKFRSLFAEYIEAGRVSRPAATRSSAKRTQVGPSAQEIRDWARSNGYEVPDRGRIPATVREAFESAQ